MRTEIEYGVRWPGATSPDGVDLYRSREGAEMMVEAERNGGQAATALARTVTYGDWHPLAAFPAGVVPEPLPDVDHGPVTDQAGEVTA